MLAIAAAVADGRFVEIGPRAQMSSARVRARRLLPFVVVTAGAMLVAVLGHPAGQNSSLAIAALGVFVATGILVVVVPWHRLPNSTKLVGVAVFCVGIALLRHSGGQTSQGSTGLLVLPVVWLAVYGRLRDVVGALAIATITRVVPVLAFGPPIYPASEWPRVIMSMLTLTLTGLVVNGLMVRVIQAQEMLATAVQSTRKLSEDDVPRAVCETTRETVDADVVSYYEHDGAGRLHLVACTDKSASVVALVIDHLPLSERSLIANREARTDGYGDEGFEAARLMASAGGSQSGRLRSVLHQPVVVGERLLGVIVVGWSRPAHGMEVEVGQVMEMLASDSGAAFERGRLMHELETVANVDQLTGVHNRRAWDAALADELSWADRMGVPATLVMIDLDHFKDYNDAHGHLAGDELLVNATAAWTRSLREIDVLARWGGEEFVLLLPGTGVDVAESTVDQLRDAMPEGQSFSAGIVAVEGLDPSPLIRAVDAALYRAKAEGRGRTMVGLVASTGARPVTTSD